MIRTAHLVLGLAALAASTSLGAGQAAAQTVELIIPPHHPSPDDAQVDRIERVPGFPGDGVERAERPRIMKPGALLLSSFDADSDAVISRPEIDVGAAAAFAAADRNQDGSLGGFEQSDWAATVGAADDVLANPMLFDADLDRSVTQVEFRAGLHRLAASLADPGTGRVSLANLAQPVRIPGDRPSQRNPADAPSPGPFGPAALRGW